MSFVLSDLALLGLIEVAMFVSCFWRSAASSSFAVGLAWRLPPALAGFCLSACSSLLFLFDADDGLTDCRLVCSPAFSFESQGENDCNDEQISSLSVPRALSKPSAQNECRNQERQTGSPPYQLISHLPPLGAVDGNGKASPTLNCTASCSFPLSE